jgi:hypothetical protein
MFPIGELKILKKYFLELNLKIQAPGKHFQAPSICLPLLPSMFTSSGWSLLLRVSALWSQQLPALLSNL